LVGYSALLQRYNLNLHENWHKSKIANSGIHRREENEGVVEEMFTKRYKPLDSFGEQLEFALKYDGLNLLIISELFKKVSEIELTDYIKSKPNSKYVRRIWFLYEFITKRRLPIDDLNQGNYEYLLEPEKYYTGVSSKVKRQRLHNNMLGNDAFCPIVRRTDIIKEKEDKNLSQQCKKRVAKYSVGLLRRAVSYLYSKETKSSFELERIKADATRTERFVEMLKEAEKDDYCEKNKLIEAQNMIVDKRFAARDYRKVQNYVGETTLIGKERIHYVCPKPSDIKELMDGLIKANRQMSTDATPPVVQAAVTGYGFVYLHPFEDGNGRIHRFLIHNILSMRGFVPKGLVFPVSAVMLNNEQEYNNSLEVFSKQVVAKLNYILREDGEMTVKGDTINWYKFIDMTKQVESLYQFIDDTIENELIKELEYLERYDRTTKKLKEIIDMPDRKIDLFLRFCSQNKGRISDKKRKEYFSFLSSSEIRKMEAVIKKDYMKEGR